MISIGMQLGGIVFGDAHWVLEDESRVWMKMSRSTCVHVCMCGLMGRRMNLLVWRASWHETTEPKGLVEGIPGI